MTNDAFIEKQGRTSAFDAATAQFSLYGAGINKKESQTPHTQGTLGDAIEWMRSPRMKELTEQLRSIDDPKEQKKFKAEMLPFATFAGTFSFATPRDSSSAADCYASTSTTSMPTTRWPA